LNHKLIHKYFLNSVKQLAMIVITNKQDQMDVFKKIKELN